MAKIVSRETVRQVIADYGVGDYDTLVVYANGSAALVGYTIAESSMWEDDDAVNNVIRARFDSEPAARAQIAADHERWVKIEGPHAAAFAAAQRRKKQEKQEALAKLDTAIAWMVAHAKAGDGYYWGAVIDAHPHAVEAVCAVLDELQADSRVKQEYRQSTTLRAYMRRHRKGAGEG